MSESMTGKTITIVTPALNEAEAIQQVIREVPRESLARLGYETHVLVVDNGSTDGTGNLAREAGAQVVLEPNRGYGRAYKAGLEKAEGDIIVCLDADLTYPLAQLAEFISLMDTQGLDFLTTNRLAIPEPGAMRVFNKVGNLALSGLIRVLFWVPLKDSQSGMWIIRKNLLRKLTLESPGMALSQELKIKAIHTTKAWREVPISYRKRVGKVKLRAIQDGFGNLFRLVRLRFSL